MKKMMTRLLVLVFVFLLSVVWASAIEYSEEMALIEKEKAQANMPPSRKAVFNPQKIIDLLTLPPASLENMGVQKSDLVNLGVPNSIAEAIIESNFDSAIVNSYLQKIGFLQQNYFLTVENECGCSNIVRGMLKI